MSVFRRTGVDREATVIVAAGPSTTAGSDIGPILVAVDGRDWRALEWAAAEASARACALRIVNVYTWLPGPTAGPIAPIVPQVIGYPGAHEDATAIVTEAADRARAVDPALQVTTHVLEGNVAGAIVREGRNDALIVLGQSSRARATDWLRRSSTAYIVRHSARPVSVIKLADQITPGPSAGRLVVYLGDTGNPSSVLGYAFRSAARRRVGLTVVYSLAAGETAECGVDPLGLQALHEACPEVDVRVRFARGPITPVLVAESQGAALVVLGAPNRRRARCGRHPSIVHRIARLTFGPVTIV